MVMVSVCFFGLLFRGKGFSRRWFWLFFDSVFFFVVVRVRR